MIGLMEQLAKQTTALEQKTIDDIFTMVKPIFSNHSDEEIKNTIWMHFFYGTIDAVYHENEIIACVRWNVSKDGMVFEVLDYVVKEGHNGFRLAKHLIARNWWRFPTVKYIRFYRDYKYPNRDPHTYKITKLLHLKKSVNRGK